MLLADLADRGLDPEQAVRFVIDGEKTLHRGIKDVFGEHARGTAAIGTRDATSPICFRSVTARRSWRGSGGAWALTNPLLAEERLELLASELEPTWPEVAGTLREGMADTLTLMRLGIDGQLAKTLGSTNPCESMIEIFRYTQRNVIEIAQPVTV